MRGREGVCEQTVFCSVCGFPPGAVTELASPQLHALSLKAHLQRSLVAVGPSRDYSQRVPGPVGTLADWLGWRRVRQRKPSPESPLGRAVVGTEWVLKEVSQGLTLMERLTGFGASQLIQQSTLSCYCFQ